MSTATAHLLEEFNKLPLQEQRVFSDIILHRAAKLDYPQLTDEELTSAAAQIFAVLDEEEDAASR